MRFLCALALFTMSAGGAASQGYDVTQTTGDRDFFFIFPNVGHGGADDLSFRFRPAQRK